MQDVCKFVLIVIVASIVMAVNILAVPAPSIQNLVLATVESALKEPVALVEAIVAGGAI